MSELMRKRFTGPFVDIKADGDIGTGTAIISTFNVVDHDGDVTVPGSFGTQDVKILVGHDWSQPQIGKGTTREDDLHAYVDFKLNLKQKGGMEWYEVLKFDMQEGKPLQEWSYGFEVKQGEWGLLDDQEAFFLKQLRVFEASPVVLGASIGTGTLELKQKTRKRNAEKDPVVQVSPDVLSFVHLHTARGIF